MPVTQRPVATPTNSSPPSVSVWPQWEENKPFALVLMLVLAFLTAFLMAKTSESLVESARVDKPVPYEHQITVDGTGKATGVPDIASVSLGIDRTAPTVAEAQDQNTAAMNALIAAVAALGVSKDDIQTANYNVYENSEYNPDTQTYENNGWTVSQSLAVKVRDTSKISAVLDTAGKNGATNISGPSFTIDDPSSLKDEARAKAVADATKKAGLLARTLGVRLERVVGYGEWMDGGYPMPMYNARSEAMDLSVPEVLPGTSDVSMNVSITYKLAD